MTDMERSEDGLHHIFRLSQHDFQKSLKDVRGPEDFASLLGTLLDGTENTEFVPCISAAFAADGDGTEFLHCITAAFAVCGLGEVDGGRTSKLFAAIQRWASAALGGTGSAQDPASNNSNDSFPSKIALWAPGSGPQRVVYSAAQCRGLLASALLLNVLDTSQDVKDRRNKGGLDFARMLRSTKPVAAQKLACLLTYFEVSLDSEGTEADLREVVFERRSAAEDEAGLQEFRVFALEEGADKICDLVHGCFKLHSATMEEVADADAFVNFANPNYGYGKFIASCTQEEILQVCCPEMNVAMLHQGMMTDAEIVNVFGVRRFSGYTGYLDSFEFAGPWHGQQIQTVLTMDATYSRHFSESMVLRDIRKAFLCFKGCRHVSTGRWGCGAFGGMPAHKFVQQVLAGSLAGFETISFSTYGQPDSCDDVLNLLVRCQPTASQLLQALLSPHVAQRSHSDSRAFVRALAASLASTQRSGAGWACGRRQRKEKEAPAGPGPCCVS
ncbi:unnamed protein product [Polarella glacialis]|uniref:PARG catalytic Macro domain-containing protein n=1 Tax=Polarella glacialis TaxID=89957 RepID=A0A813CYV3_POLGL|nr:unnamed protein product [Polarella glacialis]CAE8650047.1 unnamed protein product [Polarella glacialis]